MERASAEVLERVGRQHDTVVYAARCEIRAPRLQWKPIAGLVRPELFHSWDFRRKVRRDRSAQGQSLVAAVNTSAPEADIVIAQFCHAAFTDRYGGLRGGQSRFRQAYQSLAQRIFMAQERVTYTSPRLKKVIAVSEGVKRELMSYYNLPSTLFNVIPNGVDHNVFKPASSEKEKRELRERLRIDPDAFVCLFVGGDWDRKGLADAIHAIAPIKNAQLVVVGMGDFSRFLQIATLAGARERVLFAGRSLRPQDYYAAADMFVFPTRYEAFSLATLEAAAAGLPILAPRINGTEELIEDGVNGYFIEMNAGSILERLIELEADREKVRRMSRAIHRTSLRYNWDQIAEQQMKVFESLGDRE